MDTTDIKLNSKNPAVIAQVFSELVKGATKENNEKAFIYLRNKCLLPDPLLNETARAALIMLVDNGTYQINQLLPDFIPSLSTINNIAPLSKVILPLLYMELKIFSDKKEPYTKPNLVQHPLVKILQQNTQCNIQIIILKEIIKGYNNNISLDYLTKFNHPFYLYCVCCPILKLDLHLLRSKLWSLLINIDENNHTDNIFKLCSWLQVQKIDVAEITSVLIEEVLKSKIYLSEPNSSHTDCFILMQILLCYYSTLNGSNCELTFKHLKDTIPDNEFSHLNLCLIILSKAIQSCPSLYLTDLLDLCLSLVKNKRCAPYSFFAIKSSLLLWLAVPSLLTQDALRIANNILGMETFICRERPKILASRLNNSQCDYFFFCNPELFLSLQLGFKIECTRNKKFSVWLDGLNEAPVYFSVRIFPTLCGFLHLKNLHSENKIRLLSLITKCSTIHTELAPTVLNNILYHLSNTKDNKFQFELLKALPSMACEKENIPKITATIEAIVGESIPLSSIARELMYMTWEIDTKCYSNLENLLLTKRRDALNTYLAEDLTSKAYIIKKLAEKRPELYGKDLVPHLSKILNECSESWMSIPMVLAIEGIGHLCKAEIIDIVRTWETLVPKFKSETRVPVIKSICALISEIPLLSYTESYEKLNDEVIQFLWAYILENNNTEIINAALNALAVFKFELICANIPTYYLEEELPQQTSSILGQRTVSGNTWLKFLLMCNSREGATNFFISLVKNEISNYLKYIYQLKRQAEPDNFGGLPTNSIVKVLGEYVKNNTANISKWINTEKDKLFIACLKILSQEYIKPLPPLNWCFLQELIHIPELKGFCIDIACHQAILSGSARRLVENYIEALTEKNNDKEFVIIYKNLKYIAKSIQPIILKPFFEKTLYYTLTEFREDAVLKDILHYLIYVLEDDQIQKSNKNSIEEVISELVFIVDVNDLTFSLLLNCIGSFSEEGLEKLTKFNLSFDEAEFVKKMKIRCKIACKKNSLTPMKWINDIFSYAFKNNVRLEIYLDDISTCLKSNILHSDTPAWLMELFGQLQVKVADRCELTEIEYFSDILSLSVVYFSGLSILLPKYDYTSIKYFFPAAIAFILDEFAWHMHRNQILEWLHHMNMAENIPKEYRNIFGWALCSLRHLEEFSKNSKWMKYFDCNIQTSTNKV
ncbi:focadhesin isoform X2 [Sitophilus oryzae]|uniref:Focadhesin isoform X2 n=1 Tax=Sitophilus oryzae TaxID=7048 RepID=A0A6J2YV92_SITOR|nr:focadhesin isoform X2 [Sitophilus oryzae]